MRLNTRTPTMFRSPYVIWQTHKAAGRHTAHTANADEGDAATHQQRRRTDANAPVQRDVRNTKTCNHGVRGEKQAGTGSSSSDAIADALREGEAI